MNAWKRRWAVILGLALIVATNSVALVGVAYNRSGEPESLLALSRRELAAPYAFEFGRENSGLELGLRWHGASPYEFTSWDEPDEGAAAPWIDRAKLASLGFDLSAIDDAAKERRHYKRQSSRPALVVLELDGPAYRGALDRARRQDDEARARAAAAPDSADLKRRAEAAKTRLAGLEKEESRLFAVDAGAELAPLRARYPDRSRYAIVHAQVRPLVLQRKSMTLLSATVELTVAQVMVPLEYRAAWERGGGAGAKPGSVEVKVAFGRRLEPWVVAVSP